jgi:hypothetical protein
MYVSIDFRFLVYLKKSIENTPDRGVTDVDQMIGH